MSRQTGEFFAECGKRMEALLRQERKRNINLKNINLLSRRLTLGQLATKPEDNGYTFWLLRRNMNLFVRLIVWLPRFKRTRAKACVYVPSSFPSCLSVGECMQCPPFLQAIFRKSTYISRINPHPLEKPRIWVGYKVRSSSRSALSQLLESYLLE